MNSERISAGALLGTACGDALGAMWEGADAAPGRDGSPRIGRSLARGELVYTDDTQLTLALAEHLCATPHVEVDALAGLICEHYEPWRGYAGGMHGLVQRWREGVPVAEAATSIFPEGSFGNGAAMRVAAVGVRWAAQPDILDEVARRQARVTHAHPLGVDGAAVQAAAVGCAAASGTFGLEQLGAAAARGREPQLRARLDLACDLVQAWPSDGSLVFGDVAAALGADVTALGAVPAALWAAATARDFAEGVALALGLGGDADTVAAMAGAVLGAAGGREALPAAWVARLEDGPRGRAYVLDLARRLAESAA